MPAVAPTDQGAVSVPLPWLHSYVQGRHILWAGPLAAALLALSISVWTFDTKLSLSGDNTEFITLARSLVAGDGLTYTNLPEPYSATKYPFGLPLLLAPAAALASGWEGPGSGAPDWVWMKAIIVITFAGTAAATYLLVRHVAGETSAIVVSLLTCTQPLLVSFSWQVMSEVPFAMVSLLALWALSRGLETEGVAGNRWYIAGLLLALASYYVRSAGIVFFVAVPALLLMRGDYRRAAISFAVFVAGWLPWTLRNRAVGSGGFYFKQLFQVNPYYPDQGYIDAGGMLDRLLSQFDFHLSKGIVCMLWPSFEPGTRIVHPLSLILLALTVGALVVGYRRTRLQLPLIYAVLFTGTVMLWPWQDSRFFLPLVPILYLLFVCVVAAALNFLGQRGASWSLPWARVVAVVLVVLVNLATVQRLAAASDNDYWPEWQRYYEAGVWLRANSDQDAIIGCRKAFWMHVVSGRRTMTFAFDDPEPLLADLEAQGVDYVIIEQLGFHHTGLHLVPAIEFARERFRIVWHRANPDTWVLRFDGEQ